MKNPQNKILLELKELGVPLEHKPTMPFVLPEGYFASFKSDFLEQVSALSFADSLPKEMPQRIEGAYFEELQKNVLDEIEVIELAEGLTQKETGDVPADYFASMQASVFAKIAEEEKKETVPMTVHRTSKKKNWALAATMALLVTLGLFFINTDSSTLNLEEQLAQIPVEEIDNYISEHDYDFEAFEILENPQIITKDMQSLENEILDEIKTLSNEEIFEFVL